MCTLNKVAFEIIRGALKWPLKGGSPLIEVAATAGLTVPEFGKSNQGLYYLSHIIAYIMLNF